MPTLTQMWAALDDLGAAARQNNAARYRAVLAHARTLGLSDEQIQDAHHWGGKKRERDTRHLPGLASFPTFDWKGEPR